MKLVLLLTFFCVVSSQMMYGGCGCGMMGCGCGQPTIIIQQPPMAPMTAPIALPPQMPPQPAPMPPPPPPQPMPVYQPYMIAQQPPPPPPPVPTYLAGPPPMAGPYGYGKK